MQKFWYNSTVKFFKNESEFYDVLDPQNIQFFGSTKPIVLELGELHRFLIPQYNNYIGNGQFTLYIVDDLGKKTKIISDVKTVNGAIKYITFKSDIALSGYFILENENSIPVYYSNCVQFIDTSIFSVGVKYARVVTKHNYNRQLFDFTQEKGFFVTNLPIYEIGNYGMDAEISNERISGGATLAPKETYLDEVSRYEIKMNGNPDYLNFLQSSVTNIEFFLNGTKRTSTESIEVDETNNLGQISFVNQKDENGYNIGIDEDFVFSDLNLIEISRFPENNSVNTIANISASNNRISITYNKNFTIVSAKKARIYLNNILLKTVDSSGMFKQGRTLIINDTLLDSNGLILTIGNYRVELDSGIVKTDFDKNNQQITNWNFQISDNEQTEDFIEWVEGGKQDKTGNDNQVSTTISTGQDFVSTQWQKYDGNDFVDVISGNTQNYIFDLDNGLNQFRNSAIGNNGINYISNILKYTKSIVPTLKSVTKLNTNVGKFVWNNNGIDYGVSGQSVFQLSTDNGLNWQNFYTANAGSSNSDNTLDVNSSLLSTVPNNTVVKFRIINSGNGLTNQISNVVEVIWIKTAEIQVLDVQTQSDGSLTYLLRVTERDFVGFAISSVEKGSNTNVVNCDVSLFGDNISFVNIDTTKVKSLTIPVGFYNCYIKSVAIPIDENLPITAKAFIGYSLTPNKSDSLTYVTMDSINGF